MLHISAGFWRKVILVIFELGLDSESLFNALPSDSISCGIMAFMASEALGTKRRKVIMVPQLWYGRKGTPMTRKTQTYFTPFQPSAACGSRVTPLLRLGFSCHWGSHATEFGIFCQLLYTIVEIRSNCFLCRNLVIRYQM